MKCKGCAKYNPIDRDMDGNIFCRDWDVKEIDSCSGYRVYHDKSAFDKAQYWIKVAIEDKATARKKIKEAVSLAMFIGSTALKYWRGK